MCHIDRFNVNHALYWAVGHDSWNPLANTPQDISAEMAALELSYDRDWVRFRTSFLWASGDGNPNNRQCSPFVPTDALVRMTSNEHRWKMNLSLENDSYAEFAFK